jgi:hypothetical protein
MKLARSSGSTAPQAPIGCLTSELALLDHRALHTSAATIMVRILYTNSKKGSQDMECNDVSAVAIQVGKETCFHATRKNVEAARIYKRRYQLLTVTHIT